MTRTLPSQPDLTHLRNEAKAMLKAQRKGDADACRVLRNLARFRDSTPQQVGEADVTLLEVQQALAVEYGFENWAALKHHVESAIPRILGGAPAFVIGDRDQAIDHYVDWLGFTCEWEWRSAPGQPVIMAMRRGDFAFFLGDGAPVGSGSTVHLRVANREALAAEWESRFPGRFAGFDVTSTVTDPWGNALVFEPVEITAPGRFEELQRDMALEVDRYIDRGEALPSVAELAVLGGDPRERVGTLLDRAGVPWVSDGYIAAADVLIQHPEHAELVARRRREVIDELGIAEVELPEQPLLVIEDTVAVDDIGQAADKLRSEVRDLARRAGLDLGTPDFLAFGNSRGDRPNRRVKLRVGSPLSAVPEEVPAPARTVVLPGGPAAVVELQRAGRWEVGVEAIDRTGVTADVHRWDRRSAELWEILRVYVRDAGGTPPGNWAGAGGWQTLPEDPDASATLHLPIRRTG